MKSAFAAFVFFALLVPCAAPQSAEQYLRKFESTYKRSRTLQAEFLQQYSEGGRVTRSEAGTAYFRRPGKMRWQYATPEKNLFVVDGKYAWFYVPADRTVSRVAAKQSEDWRTPLALLAGEMKVSRVCASTVMAKSQPQDLALVRLDCTIRGTQGELKAGRPHDVAFFDINKATGELASVVVTGAGGVRMEMNFSHWQFDPPVEEVLFHFQPAQGVAIVDGDQLLAGPAQGIR